MSVLRLICSPRGAASESYRLSQFVVRALARTDAERGRELVDFDVNQLSHVDAEYAWALGSPADPAQATGTLCESDGLIRALAAADYLVIATPMHNYTVPSALKAWVDHVLRVRHSFNATRQGKVGLLADRPVFLAAASGGFFTGERARQPDFLTPYLKAAMATMGLKSFHAFAVEGTAMGREALQAARLRAQAQIAGFFAPVPGEQEAVLPA